MFEKVKLSGEIGIDKEVEVARIPRVTPAAPDFVSETYYSTLHPTNHNG